MLRDVKMFAAVEQLLRENGTLAQFEGENGTLRGRMMITLGAIPKEAGVTEEQDVLGFVGSFDFYDVEIGIALKRDTYEAASQVWIADQREDADQPLQEWIEFFVQTLVQNLSSEGYGVPMYTFISDDAAFTVVPTAE